MMTLDSATYRQLDPVAAEDEIVAAEQALGFRFPDELRKAIPRCHSGSPTPQMVLSVEYPGVGSTETTVGRFLSVTPGSSYNLVDQIEPLRREGLLPIGVIPFAVEGGGDMFALDYRDSAANPRVVYVALGAAEEDSDTAHITPLASSFSDFLAMLEPPDEA